MNRILVFAQRSLLFVGIVLCGFWIFQTEVRHRVSARVPVRETIARRSPATGSLLARIEIPLAHVATSILEGVDEEELSRAAGHVPRTALPGGLGNFAVAGHRDTVFRNIRLVKPGMDVLITTGTGHYRYRVQSTGVVSPSNVSILDVSDSPTLTLISCYPFRYIGPAPLRFYVRADLVTVAPIS